MWLSHVDWHAANASIIQEIMTMQNLKYHGPGSKVELGETEGAYSFDLTDVVYEAGSENSSGKERQNDVVATTGGFHSLPDGAGFRGNVNIIRDPSASRSSKGRGGSRKRKASDIGL